MTKQNLSRFRAGDPVLFRELVEGISPRLRAALRTFSAGEADLDDLLQEVWVLAFRKRETFSGSGSLVGWLYVIARNVGVGRVRRRKESGMPGEMDRLPHPSSGPWGEMEERAQREAILEAVLELPKRQREVVMLRMMEGRSTREVARSLDCAEGTVKAALHKGLAKLRVPLKEWKP